MTIAHRNVKLRWSFLLQHSSSTLIPHLVNIRQLEKIFCHTQKNKREPTKETDWNLACLEHIRLCFHTLRWVYDEFSCVPVFQFFLCVYDTMPPSFEEKAVYKSHWNCVELNEERLMSLGISSSKVLRNETTYSKGQSRACCLKSSRFNLVWHPNEVLRQ